MSTKLSHRGTAGPSHIHNPHCVFVVFRGMWPSFANERCRKLLFPDAYFRRNTRTVQHVFFSNHDRQPNYLQIKLYTYCTCTRTNICKLKYEYEDKLFINYISCIVRYSTRTYILSSFITTYLRRYSITFVLSYLRRYESITYFRKYECESTKVQLYSIFVQYCTCTRTINNARCRLVVVHVRVAFSTLTVFRRDGGRRRGQRRRGTLSHNHNGHG